MGEANLQLSTLQQPRKVCAYSIQARHSGPITQSSTLTPARQSDTWQAAALSIPKGFALIGG